MNETQHIATSIRAEELAELFAEIALYLEVVDAFRREGHEPIWRLEVTGEVLR